MTNLEILDLAYNNFKGHLPSQWSAFTQLQELYLFGNLFSGSLPVSWSTMTQMHYFYAHSPLLKGPLPPQWSAWKHVNIIAIEGALEGTLPHSWSSMTSLALLDIGGYYNADCQIHGNIPDSWIFHFDTDFVLIIAHCLTISTYCLITKPSSAQKVCVFQR